MNINLKTQSLIACLFVWVLTFIIIAGYICFITWVWNCIAPTFNLPLLSPWVMLGVHLLLSCFFGSHK